MSGLKSMSLELWHSYAELLTREKALLGSGISRAIDLANDYAARYTSFPRYIRDLEQDAFRDLFRKVVAEMYPERQRVFFIHIPRTAGSNLREGLISNSEAVLGDALRSPWLPDFRDHIKALGSVVENLDSGVTRIFLTGHVTPDTYLDLKLIRPGDKMFCLIRDPIDAAISHLKYEAKTIAKDRNLTKPGSAYMASTFLPRSSAKVNPNDWRKFVDSLLRDKIGRINALDFSVIDPYRNITEAYTKKWFQQPSASPVLLRTVNICDYSRLKKALHIDLSTRRNASGESINLSDEARVACREAWATTYGHFDKLNSPPTRLYPGEFDRYFYQQG